MAREIKAQGGEMVRLRISIRGKQSWLWTQTCGPKPYSSFPYVSLSPDVRLGGPLWDLERCLSVAGRDGREALSWRWCLLILQNSPVYITFHGAQKRSAHGGKILCLETETFKFQAPRERRMTLEAAVGSSLLSFIPPLAELDRWELWLGKRGCTCACTLSESQVNGASGFKRADWEINWNQGAQPRGSESQDGQEMVVSSELQVPLGYGSITSHFNITGNPPWI